VKNLIKIEITKPKIPIDWDCDESVKKVKQLLANGGREAFRNLTRYEKMLNGTNVYFIQSGKNGSIKIGEAQNTKERLKQLQIGNPEKLYLIGIIKNVPRIMEKEIQAKFRKYHLRFEWYKAEIKEDIKAMINE